MKTTIETEPNALTKPERTAVEGVAAMIEELAELRKTEKSKHNRLSDLLRYVETLEMVAETGIETLKIADVLPKLRTILTGEGGAS